MLQELNFTVSSFSSKVRKNNHKSLDLNSNSPVGAKQCFDCAAKADQPELSNCGNFDETTPKCTVEEDGFCFKAAIYRVNGTAR